MNETRIFDGFIKYFLPNSGFAIENLILYGSLTINDNIVKKHQIKSIFRIKFILGTKNL